MKRWSYVVLTIKQKETLVEMRNKGVGYATIAKALSINRDQVRGFCKSKAAKVMGLHPDIRGVKESKKTICKICGKQFDYKTSKSAIYCSAECKKRSAEMKKLENRKSKVALCRNCNKEFVKTNGMQEYCSKGCRIVTCVCEICSDEYAAKRSDPINVRKFCSNECRDKARSMKHEEYYIRFSEVHKGMVVPVTLYEGSNKDVTVWCITCQSRTTRKAAQFLDNSRVRGCARCAKGTSTGELKIKQWLDRNNVNYKEQYSFISLSDKAPLRYDFAVTDEQGEVSMLIEYDGRQHYEAVERFGGEKEFERQLKSDQLKNDFAKIEGIKLVRISFKDKNKLEEILESILISPHP